MSMFSEVATECTIKIIVVEIEKELAETQNPETREALKKVGRFALTQFEWATPEWAKEYSELFREEYFKKRLRILPRETDEIIPNPRVRVFDKDSSGFTVVEAMLKPGEDVCWRCGSIADDPESNLEVCPVCGKDFND